MGEPNRQRAEQARTITDTRNRSRTNLSRHRQGDGRTMGATMTLSDELREHMRKLGRKGGKRSLETMTPAARLKRSRKAAKAAGRAHKEAKRLRKANIDNC